MVAAVASPIDTTGCALYDTRYWRVGGAMHRRWADTPTGLILHDAQKLRATSLADAGRRWERATEMVTYEDVTELFLMAVEATGLTFHPEFWLNSQTLEREFACALHQGPCEEAEEAATCSVSFAWGPLDTVLSQEGAAGICEFFHEPDEDCPHLHTENVPPLALDLAYTLPLDHAMRLNELDLRQLARRLKLRASERSSRAVATQPTISLTLGDQTMEAEAITIQQRVELSLWNPDDLNAFPMRGSGGEHQPRHGARNRPRASLASQRDADDADDADDANQPHPEDWLPHLFAEVADDILGVLVTLESSRSSGNSNGQQN